MTGINFDKWSPIPNSEIDNLCHNEHGPVKVRVRWAIIRMIVGLAKNRGNMSADISFLALAKRTSANVRVVKRAIKQLEAEGEIEINRGGGRGHRNTYRVEFNGLQRAPKSEMEEHIYYDKEGKEHTKLMPKGRE